MEHVVLPTHASWVAKPTGMYFLVLWHCILSRHFENGLSTSKCKTVLLGQITTWQEADACQNWACLNGHPYALLSPPHLLVHLAFCGWPSVMLVSLLVPPLLYRLVLMFNHQHPIAVCGFTTECHPYLFLLSFSLFSPVLEMKLKALHMLDKCSTTELHPNPCPHRFPSPSHVLPGSLVKPSRVPPTPLVKPSCVLPAPLTKHSWGSWLY